MGLEAFLGLVGLLAPPAIDLAKKVFLKDDKDTPEATMSALATTKPEVMPQYVTSLASWLEAQAKYFNRDIAGQPSMWIINLRASIRPIATVVALVALTAQFAFPEVKLDPGAKGTCILIVTNWFGTKITI